MAGVHVSQERALYCSNTNLKQRNIEFVLIFFLTLDNLSVLGFFSTIPEKCTEMLHKNSNLYWKYVDIERTCRALEQVGTLAYLQCVEYLPEHIRRGLGV